MGMTRQLILALGYGGVAGAVAALTLWLMQQLSSLIWSGPETRLYIAAIIMTGGAIIALLRHWYAGEGLAAQIAQGPPTSREQVRNIALLMAMAVVAVAFGGAVGPEAGLLAIVAELGALVSLILARDAADRRYISEVGTAATLGGLYGSPPGGAAATQDDPQSPKWQLYLAAFAGLVGFVMTTRHVLHGHGMRIDLPPYLSPHDGSDLYWAFLPALFGVFVGVAFVKLTPALERVLALCGSPTRQTLIGSAMFAAIASIVPIVRFSGHAELNTMLQTGAVLGPLAFITLALLKAMATALCLSSGWRGGAAFPLLFMGAAAGAAAYMLYPAIPLPVALIAGMAGCLTVGMGKPIAAGLIALLLIGSGSVGALAMGVMIGWLASLRWPAKALH